MVGKIRMLGKIIICLQINESANCVYNMDSSSVILLLFRLECKYTNENFNWLMRLSKKISGFFSSLKIIVTIKNVNVLYVDNYYKWMKWMVNY